MNIVKKSGKLEQYTRDKIRRSIGAASDESTQPLTESDLSRLVRDFDQIAEGKETMTSQQVAVVIIGLLYANGYRGVLEKYAQGKHSVV